MEHHGPRHGPPGLLRQQHSASAGAEGTLADNLSQAETCSFTDSEAGPSSDGLARHGLLQQHAGPQPGGTSHARQHPQLAQQQQPPLQQQQSSLRQQLSHTSSMLSAQVSLKQPPMPPVAADVAAPARIITPHLSRADVRRGLLHHVAKAFGIHLKGDVATNEISTAKYTMLTFLPVNLFEQFLRVANMYFLLMVILQLIPGLSPVSLFTTVAPLVFVLAVNAIKEGYDDVHRHRCDAPPVLQLR